MRLLLIALAIGLFSCGQNAQHALPAKKPTIDKKKSITSKKSDLLIIGEKIQGDFNGDGQTEFARATKIKEGQGNPVDGGTPDEYEIQFSDANIKSISAGCCEIQLINEGDLNNNGTDEISAFQAPPNGCMHSMTTYSLTNKTWKQIVPTFLIPTACESISDEDLQKRIFKESGGIYYLDIGDGEKTVKTKVTVPE